MTKELEEYKYSNLELLREIWFNVPDGSRKIHQKHFDLILSKLNELQAIKEAKPSKAMEKLDKVNNYLNDVYDYKEIKEEVRKDIDTIKQALQRLNKYEQILSSGRLTDRNYKNTTLDIDSCKPYLRLGKLEDIYEEVEDNE